MANRPTHTKEQYLRSQKYRHCRDALAVILEDGKTYSADKVEKMLDAFMKRPIVEKKN